MAVAPVGGAAPVVRATPPTPPVAAAPAGGTGFAGALDAVARAGAQADQLGTQVATGQLQDVHEFMAASSKAQLAVELTVAVRNRAVEAYQEIMRMQV